jgi:hypothetical protein
LIKIAGALALGVLAPAGAYYAYTGSDAVPSTSSESA